MGDSSVNRNMKKATIHYFYKKLDLNDRSINQLNWKNFQ